jgi:PAS domain S-box-containing protein
MKYKLSDLIDIEKNQRLLDSFCDVVGIAAAIIDLEGEVLVGSRWQRICTDFHRVNERTYEKCIESDTQLANELQQGKRFSIYQCRNGLTDAASPIIIEDEHIANAFIGQFLLKTPDREFFRRQATTYEFEETAYLEALSKVPIVTKEKLPGILDFLTNFAEIVAMMGLEHKRQKEAQEALRESEERLQAIFESNPSPMVAYDPEGHAQYVNPAFTELFGWSLDELKGRRIPFVPDDQKEITGKKLDKVYSTGKNVQFETKRLTRQGDTIDVIVSGAYIKGLEGEPVQMIANLTDISERKKLEAQLQQSQRMEALGTLGGGVAHDFNNLLMGIQGRTSLMLMDKDSSHPDFEHLKGIEDYVKSAANLTRQLLGFTRGGKYEVKPTDINELIKKSSRMFGRTKKEIKIHRKYQEDVWTVETDQGQIEQVLMNLYVNAWQAMPGGGDLYLQTENVTIDEDYVKPFKIEPGRYVKISVTDTGVGMDEATRQRIFDPFFTTKEMGRGTGLGLASAYGIIKNHSGFINVYSEKGEGTIFNIYLPASESEVSGQKAEISEDVGHGDETVLLIDDEDMIIDVGEQLLENMGYTVLIARSGKEATEIYEKNKDKIDIVILDMIMPNISGGATFDRLREIDPDIKVLLSSGYSINGQATEILERGCDGFIQKPFNMKQLSRKLRQILDKE